MLHGLRSFIHEARKGHASKLFGHQIGLPRLQKIKAQLKKMIIAKQHFSKK